MSFPCQNQTQTQTQTATFSPSPSPSYNCSTEYFAIPTPQEVSSVKDLTKLDVWPVAALFLAALCITGFVGLLLCLCLNRRRVCKKPLSNTRMCRSPHPPLLALLIAQVTMQAIA